MLNQVNATIDGNSVKIIKIDVDGNTVIVTFINSSNIVNTKNYMFDYFNKTPLTLAINATPI